MGDDSTRGTDQSVSAHMVEVNNVLIRNLVDRFSEALKKINVILEANGEIEGRSLEELQEALGILRELKEETLALVSTDKAISSSIEEVHSLVVELLGDRPYHDEDREELISFLRKASSAVASWSSEDRVMVLDTIEKAPGALKALKKKLTRLYLLLAVAGAAAVLTSVGAPEWLKKLASLIFGAG